VAFFEVLNDLVDRVAFTRRLHYIASASKQPPLVDDGLPVMPLGQPLGYGAVGLVPFKSLDSLMGENGKQQIHDLLDRCAGGWPWHCDDLLPQQMATHWPDLYLLGLARPMIAAAESYLQEPCLYLGPTLKVERVAPKACTRMWHIDVEDLRMLRVLIYLNDVGPRGGPLEVLSAADSDRAQTAFDYRSGYLSDSQMEAQVPASRWIPCYGQAGDALLFDGTRLFHRAQPPMARERYSLTFSYATRKPLQIYRKSRLVRHTQEQVTRGLSGDLRSCLPRARAF
jgi:hypothetical protein